MAMVNVNRSNPDVFYRYKMPKLIAKVEGKGNGIKTVICNMSDIGKALQRPATYPTKFFGCELGAQTQFDIKRDRYIVNGAHEGDKLQDLLDGFIRKFVLCPECDNPETVYSVHAKAQTIGVSCRACGYSGKLDMRHKLTTFILRNPPSGLAEGGKEKSKKPESTGDEDGEGGSGEENNGQGEGVGDGAGDDTMARVYANDDEVEWGEDASEEAQKARQMEISRAAASLALTADLEKTPQERADDFFNFVKGKIDECKGKLAPAYSKIVAEAERLELKDKGVLIVSELLLTAEILKNFKEHKNLFLMFTYENQKAQKYLLGAFEKLVGIEYREQLLNKAATILKCMYDLDLVDEEVFLDWGKKVSKKYVKKEIGSEIHAKAAPFIKWLQTAEEESSEEEDEEEEEDGVEVSFTHAEKVGLVESKPAASKMNGTKAAAEEDDDDLDIDDI